MPKKDRYGSIYGAGRTPHVNRKPVKVVYDTHIWEPLLEGWSLCLNCGLRREIVNPGEDSWYAKFLMNQVYYYRGDKLTPEPYYYGKAALYCTVYTTNQ